MAGDVEGISGAGVLTAGITLVTTGASIVSTNLTGGVASIGAGIGLIVVAYFLLKAGLVKATLEKVTTKGCKCD